MISPKRLAQTVYFISRTVESEMQNEEVDEVVEEVLTSHADGFIYFLGSQPLARSYIGYIDVTCVLPIVLPKNSLCKCMTKTPHECMLHPGE